jgi:hypothetical protein
MAATQHELDLSRIRVPKVVVFDKGESESMIAEVFAGLNRGGFRTDPIAEVFRGLHGGYRFVVETGSSRIVGISNKRYDGDAVLATLDRFAQERGGKPVAEDMSVEEEVLLCLKPIGVAQLDVAKIRKENNALWDAFD